MRGTPRKLKIYSTTDFVFNFGKFKIIFLKFGALENISKFREHFIAY